MVKRSVLILLLLLLLALLPRTAVADAICTEQTVDNGLFYIACVPASSAGGALPLIVVLHGCSQSADVFVTATEMAIYAEEFDFVAVFPEQPASANASNCWNWFLPEHQARGAGEPAQIAAVVEEVKQSYTIDDDRIYVTGMSAGGAMSVILGATYPDLFAAIGVAAGLEYKAGTDLVSSVLAMQTGGPDPDSQGTMVYNNMGELGRVVPTIVFHGTLDQTVRPVNGGQVISQWAQTSDWADDGLDNDSIDDVAEQTTADQVPGGRSYTRSVYRDQQGTTILEFYLVENMTHNWSGGAQGGSYSDPTGPESSVIMINFFFDHPMRSTPSATTIASIEVATVNVLAVMVGAMVGLLLLSVAALRYVYR